MARNIICFTTLTMGNLSMHVACYILLNSLAASKMPPDHLAILCKALSVLEEQIASWKVCLKATLAKNEALAPEDEAWLDNKAHLVDEHCTINILLSASDSDEAYGRTKRGSGV